MRDAGAIRRRAVPLLGSDLRYLHAAGGYRLYLARLCGAVPPRGVTLRPCGLRQRRGDADANRAPYRKGLRRNAPISAAQNALDGQAVRLPGDG